MISGKRGSGVLLLLFFSGTAMAAPFSCPNLGTLERQTKSCGDNKFFSSAAARCISDLNKLIKARTDATAALLAAKAKKLDEQGHRQSGDFSASAADYEASKIAIEELMLSAQRSRGQVNGYLNKIYYPDGWDSVLLEGQNLDKFLKSSICYSRARTALEGAISRIDQSILSLQKGYFSARALNTATTAKGGKLESAGGNAARSTRGEGAGKSVKGEADPDDSDISGLKIDELKRKKGQSGH